jgi:hypothetical protein
MAYRSTVSIGVYRLSIGFVDRPLSAGSLPVDAGYVVQLAAFSFPTVFPGACSTTVVEQPPPTTDETGLSNPGIAAVEAATNLAGDVPELNRNERRT